MSIQRWLVVSATAVALVVLAACAGKSRQEVLSFFFDGVPPPGGFPPSSSTPDGPTPDAAGAIGFAAAQQFFPHTPYRENKCEGCHDATSGQLVTPIQKGLCLTCHTKLVEEKKFVHSPVAVGDCSLCHHYHGSPLPNLLLAVPIKTCMNCHDQADLTTGEHHAQADRACTDCHDPHGGNDRFFVKRAGP
jgi:predicted CXXCH cytochrome family protein